MASSSASSSTGNPRRRRSVLKMRRVNREDEYEEPRRVCHHRLTAPRWTSWSESNPGRRFYGCPFSNQTGGCKYFSWHDDEFGERPKTVIKELLDYIDKLYEENSKLRNCDYGREVKAVFDEVDVEVSKILERNQLILVAMRKRERKFKIVVALLLLICICLALIVKGNC